MKTSIIARNDIGVTPTTDSTVESNGTDTSLGLAIAAIEHEVVHPKINSSDKIKAVLRHMKSYQFEPMFFKDFGPKEYGIINQAMTEKRTRHELAARTAYFPLVRELIIYTPLPCHAQIVSDFKADYMSMMHSIPINHRLITMDAFGNSSFRNEHIHAIPDFQAVLQRFPSKTAHYSPMVLWVGECAVTQHDHDNVATRKLEGFVAANPEIEAAFLISIKEHTQFHRPSPNSPAAQAFRRREIQDFATFLPCYTEETAFGPIVVEGHTWIHVTEITWTVWIKGKSSSIDLKNTSSDLFATGMLYPNIDMAHVEELLTIGTLAIKDKTIIMQTEADSDGDYSALQSWEPVVDFQWGKMSKRLSQAVRNSAHVRYVDWHSSNGSPKRKGSTKDFRARKKARRT